MSRKKNEPTPAYRAMVELRRSNAAQPIPSGTAYRRRAKHRNRTEETS